MDKSGIDSVLTQLRAASTMAAGASKSARLEEHASKVDFGEKLKSALDQVNNTQQTADKLTMEFVSGETDKNLHEVMISLQKANISFQSMIQVRNKLVTAYQEIMNMQV
ncbi:MAG: flagellar hook-basal body complex protein FliE [Nitrosomonas sp.]|jgi:flagellar hook-basal body complex protein FliE|nr:flagellar hook-basal body complex protein FliE [Nitrosomonas sp.]